MANEKFGQTLQATALVHEAYLRLVDVQKAQHWNSRGHFFGAAAEAMRRILVESARRRRLEKHGGGRKRIELGDADPAYTSRDDEILSVDEALKQLAAEDPKAVRLVEFRYFAGLSIAEAAELLGIARSTAYEHWAFARASLRVKLQVDSDDRQPDP